MWVTVLLGALLFNSCLAPIDPQNPPDRPQPMEEVLRPVEEVLRMLLFLTVLLQLFMWLV